MATDPCNTCGGEEYVEFAREGEIVCQKCGTVKEARMIDERSEWRTFSDKDKESVDPNRVGGATNPLLENHLTTAIARDQGDLSRRLGRTHARTNNPNQALVKAFSFIGSLCDKIKLQGGAKDRACELYKDAQDAKRLKGRPMKALAAACLLWACRQEGRPRTIKELCQAVDDPTVAQKVIGRCFKDLQQNTKDQMYAGGAAPNAMAVSMKQMVQTPADWVVKYCNDMHMGRDWDTAQKQMGKDQSSMAHKLRMVCQTTAINAKPADRRMAWDGRTPVSIASAIVFVVQLLYKMRSQPVDSKDEAAGSKPLPDLVLQQVATVSSVSEATIRVAYRDLYPAIAELLPKDFATAEELARLPNPLLAAPAAAAAGEGPSGVKLEA